MNVYILVTYKHLDHFWVTLTHGPFLYIILIFTSFNPHCFCLLKNLWHCWKWLDCGLVYCLVFVYFVCSWELISTRPSEFFYFVQKSDLASMAWNGALFGNMLFQVFFSRELTTVFSIIIVVSFCCVFHTLRYLKQRN